MIRDRVAEENSGLGSNVNCVTACGVCTAFWTCPRAARRECHSARSRNRKAPRCTGPLFCHCPWRCCRAVVTAHSRHLRVVSLQRFFHGCCYRASFGCMKPVRRAWIEHTLILLPNFRIASSIPVAPCCRAVQARTAHEGTSRRAGGTRVCRGAVRAGILRPYMESCGIRPIRARRTVAAHDLSPHEGGSRPCSQLGEEIAVS